MDMVEATKRGCERVREAEREDTINMYRVCDSNSVGKLRSDEDGCEQTVIERG